jgi:hypothetical protein
MHIMRSLVDDMEIIRRSDGTTVVLRAEVASEPPSRWS